MRILYATPFYVPELKFGGPPQKIHSLARGVNAAGHDVRVLTFDHAARTSAETNRIDGVAVQYLPWRGHGLRQFPTRRDMIASEARQADVVHCYGLYTALTPLAARAASRAASRAAVSIVQEPLGMYPPRARKQPVKRLYNALFSRRMLNSAAAVIAASAGEAADLRAFVPHANVVLRRNGIDVGAFTDLPSAEHLRRRWDIAAGEQVVLFVGRLSPIKNLEQLVAAFRRLKIPSSSSKVEGARARLVLVGPAEPEYEKRLRALVDVEGISERVLFAGPLYEDGQKAALALADLFVLPSLNESFGNAAAEAVAAGVPVLLTDTCGIAPMIHGRAGMAVPLGLDSLADGLQKMLDPDFRSAMTARRDEVKRELSWDEPIAQTIALYEQIVAENRRCSQNRP